MKKVLSILTFLILSVWYTSLSSPVQAQLSEQIDLFHSEITINQDTSLTIKEKIDYRTTLDKHGIYRYFPISYNRDGVKAVLRISELSVVDETGKKIPYERSYDNAFLTLKIGDPDSTFTGRKTYLISYKVEKAINQFDTHAELYWDITGEGWQIPITQSQALIRSPFAKIEKSDCFTGAVGGNDGMCQDQFVSDEEVTFNYYKQINYGDNMTVAIALSKNNQLIFPSQWDNFWSWLWYNWSLLVVPLPLLIMGWWWWKKGRDVTFISANVFDVSVDRPSRLAPLAMTAREPFVYEPLKDLTPGEAGALLNEKVDPQDVVAEILELARKKYLKIEVIEAKKLWGLSTSRDYQMTKLKEAHASLPDVQQYLQQQLFKTKDVVTVSGLKGTFYTAMQSASAKIEKALVERQIYTHSPSSARAWAFAVYSACAVGSVVLVANQLVPLQIFWPLVLIAIQVPFGLLLAYNMPQKTAVGHNLWLQARGLRKTIKYGKWREEVKEKNLFIEEVLPFAVALGVVHQLAQQMKDLNLEPPKYLQTSNLATWNTYDFVSGFSHEVSSGLSYNPSSSSSSGGSGFSGGSSGGGGGGGGGGSW